MEIENTQVKKIYDRWQAIWRNKDVSDETRYKAFSIMNTIEALVIIYEHEEILDDENIDDLFIAWNPKGVRPIFPEERPRMIERMKENLRNMLSSDSMDRD